MKRLIVSMFSLLCWGVLSWGAMGCGPVERSESALLDVGSVYTKRSLDTNPLKEPSEQMEQEDQSAREGLLDDAQISFQSGVLFTFDTLDERALAAASEKQTLSSFGTMEKSQDGLEGQAGENKVTFQWDAASKPKACTPCLVSAYFITDDKTGKRLKSPHDAYVKDFAFTNGGKSYVSNGTIVDAPLGKKGAPLSRPCIPTSRYGAPDGENKVDPYGLGASRRLIGEDAPNFVKPGFTVHFETCAVCFKSVKPTLKRPNRSALDRVLQCMQWVYKPGAKKPVLIEKKDGKIDQGAVSSGFKEAIEKNMSLYPHGLK